MLVYSQHRLFARILNSRPTFHLIQRHLRNDLRLVVMSATLGGGLAERLSTLMQSSSINQQQVPILTSEGRAYPVQVNHIGPWTRDEGMEGGMAEAVLMALKKHQEGDILAFLPGVGEIKNTERRLMQSMSSSSRVKIFQLHGSLPPRQQDFVISRKGAGQGERRVILSTPIAESSVTVEGVRTVIDSGFRRSPVFDTSSAIDRLKLRRISHASADQRAGRAGRQGPGQCYRLWEQGEVEMDETTPPEIVDAGEWMLWGRWEVSGR